MKKLSNYRLLLLLLISFTGAGNQLFSQNVSINATGTEGNASSGLDVDFGNKGLLIPRVSLASTTDVSTIPNPASSLLVYNSNASMTNGAGIGFYYYTGSLWKPLVSGSAVTSVSATAPVAVANGTTTPSVSLQGSAGSIFYGTGGGSSTLAAGSAGQVLTSGGTGAPAWTTATYPATAGTSGNVLTSTGTNWTSQAAPGVPSGAILMWSGTLATIPSGWALCDGTNGTPNLIDKFIYSVSTSENPGATGGASTHSHSVPRSKVDWRADADNVVLTQGTAGSQYVVGRLGQQTRWESGSSGGWTAGSRVSDFNNYTTSTGGTSRYGNYTAYTQESTATDAISNIPPYYKLAFIMKL